MATPPSGRSNPTMTKSLSSSTRDSPTLTEPRGMYLERNTMKSMYLVKILMDTDNKSPFLVTYMILIRSSSASVMYYLEIWPRA